MPIPDFNNNKRREKRNRRIAKRKAKVAWNRYLWFFYRKNGHYGVAVHEIDVENMFKSKKE